MTAPAAHTVEGGRRLLCTRPDPLITVVTVVRNAAATVEQALRSVLDAQLPEVEYLVLDGGSTDGTLDIIRRYGDRLDYWRSLPDTGVYDAMNAGLSLARGTWIAFLNADDWYEPEGLQQLAAAAREHSAADVIYGNAWIVRDDLGIRYRLRANPDIGLGMYIKHQAMFVKRDLYLRQGGFDTSISLAADFDFLVAAVVGGAAFWGIEQYVVNYRDGGLSARHMFRSMRQGLRILRRRAGCFSGVHLRYLARYGKSLFLAGAGGILTALYGKERRVQMQKKYLMNVIAREREEL